MLFTSKGKKKVIFLDLSRNAVYFGAYSNILNPGLLGKNDINCTLVRSMPNFLCSTGGCLTTTHSTLWVREVNSSSEKLVSIHACLVHSPHLSEYSDHLIREEAHLFCPCGWDMSR